MLFLGEGVRVVVVGGRGRGFNFCACETSPRFKKNKEGKKTVFCPECCLLKPTSTTAATFLFFSLSLPLSLKKICFRVFRCLFKEKQPIYYGFRFSSPFLVCFFCLFLCLAWLTLSFDLNPLCICNLFFPFKQGKKNTDTKWLLRSKVFRLPPHRKTIWNFFLAVGARGGGGTN